MPSLGWEGKGYPLQYPGLENSIDCIVCGVTKSWTRLSNFHFTSLSLHFSKITDYYLSCNFKVDYQFSKVAELCLTLCDPLSCSSPGSFVHEILRARILERVAFPLPAYLPCPWIEPVSSESPALQVDSLSLSHQRSPKLYFN